MGVGGTGVGSSAVGIGVERSAVGSSTIDVGGIAVGRTGASVGGIVDAGRTAVARGVGFVGVGVPKCAVMMYPTFPDSYEMRTVLPMLPSNSKQVPAGMVSTWFCMAESEKMGASRRAQRVCLDASGARVSVSCQVGFCVGVAV